MGSDLPAAFTAFHSLKRWEVFLLPVSQPPFSLDLLSARLEQHPSPALELWELAPGCPACVESRAGGELVPCSSCHGYPQLLCQTGAAGSRDFITAWREGALMCERGGKSVILALGVFCVC